MNALTKVENNALVTMDEAELMAVLRDSLYPGAKDESIKMVLSYCKAANLDPMQKPVHIVPMLVSTGEKDKDGWDIKKMRDVVMPGIGLYRTQATRSGEYAGMSEPEYGPEVDEKLGDAPMKYPLWCRITVKRLLGERVVEFSAVEYWRENYATKSNKSIEPNAMWKRRPFAQLAKCAEAQALRKAFPEFGAQPTAEEMENAANGDYIDHGTGAPAVPQPRSLSQGHQPEKVAASDPPDGEDHPPSALAQVGGDGVKQQSTEKPLNEQQKKILRAKLQNAVLSELDLKSKFGKGFDDLTFSDFNKVSDWISNPASGPAA